MLLFVFDVTRGQGQLLSCELLTKLAQKYPYLQTATSKSTNTATSYDAKSEKRFINT